jgi:hypothetical protein
MKYVLMDVNIEDEGKLHEAFQMFIVTTQGRISAYVIYIQTTNKIQTSN